MAFVRLLLSIAALALSTPASAQPRSQYLFNDDWRMAVGDPANAQANEFDDVAWKRVTLPRALNEDEAYRVGSHDLTTGIVWYRKSFVVPAGIGPASNGRAFLVFEGARQAADVFVNGVRVVTHENGVSGFGADLTSHLKPAPFPNLIAVRVDSRWDYKERATGTEFQWNNKSFNANYGGLNQSVRLHLTNDLYQTLPLYSTLGTTGVYIWADKFDIAAGAATIHAESQVRNDSDRPRAFSYRVTLTDPDGKRVGAFDGASITLEPGATGTISAQAPLAGLSFWSWGYGYLYAVETALIENGKVVDEVTTRTGFRKTAFRDGMIFLNDRVIQVHGYAQRSTNEWPALGTDVPPWISDFSNRLMVESGGNLNRWMHVTPSRQDVESHDRVGLMQALPAGDAEGDSRGRQWEQRIELMRDAVIAFRNNPSVIFYEAGNENVSEAHMAEMKAVRDQFDPHGGRAIGSREMLDSKVAEYGGEMLYINKSAGKPLWAMEYARDESARKYQDELTEPFHKDSPDYNRNQDSFTIVSVQRWNDYYRERPGSGDRVSSGGVNINFTDSNSHMRGDNNYRRSGEVDAMRLPKDVFFAHRVMWDGWVDVERQRTHLIGHWNYAPGTVKDVVAVSSGEKVELRLNGRSLGFGKRSDTFLFTFAKVAWSSGRLEAISYGANNKEVSRHALETSGAPSSLRLKSITGPSGWRADGSDIALIDVEVLDAKGRRVPTALNTISFKVDGPAEWRGGIAQGDSKGAKPRDISKEPTVNIMKQDAGKNAVTQYAGTRREQDNFILSTTLPVEGGINRVALRSTHEPGRVTIIASADGLKSATTSLDSLAPARITGNWRIAGDALSVDLSRGPTPLTPSFKPWRESLKPITINAGSNAATLDRTHDDDETTHWSSDGRLGNAWIEWQFDKPQVVDEISLKLIGWRIRSYPLRVTVDGVRVYEGEPAKNLGYTTLALKPRTGSRVRLALMGSTVDRDAFGNIVEITGARAGLDTGAEKVPAGTALGVFEAELHRRLDKK